MVVRAWFPGSVGKNRMRRGAPTGADQSPCLLALYQRQDAGLDGFGQRRPSLEDGRQVGVDWDGTSENCAGICAALVGDS